MTTIREAVNLISIGKNVKKIIKERDTYRELCVELQATVAKLHSQIRDNAVEKVCCGDAEGDWPDWALEALRIADEMNAKAEGLLGNGENNPV